MPDKNSTEKLYTDADSYLKLGHLLRKKRDEQSTRDVHEIVESNIPVEEKVKKIKLIDVKNISDVKNPVAPEPKAVDKKLDKLLESRNVVNETHAIRNRLRIKIMFKHSTFFVFWLKEFAGIRKFADKTQLIKYRKFPPKIRLSMRAKSFLTYSLQKDAAELLEVLPDFFHEAWLYLEKWEYNLVVQFFHLVYKLANTNFHMIDYNNQYILIHFLEIEKDFLTCHYMPEYPTNILSNLRYVLERNSNYKKKLNRIISIANRILLKQSKAPCLYNIIRAVNIVEFRKYIEFKDMINQSFSSVVSNFDFECTETVRKRINSFIKETVDYLKKLLSELNEIERLKTFIPQHDPKDIMGQSFSLVRRFYEANEAREINYNSDVQKITQFTLNIFTKYINEFENFLRHQIKMEKIGHIRIFDPEFFDYEINKLRNILMKLNKHLFIVPHFNLELYFRIRNGSRDTNTTELVTIQYFEEIAGIVVEIARKLSNIYLYYKSSNNSAENWKPIHQSFIISRKIYIPFWENKIYSSGILHGKSFNQALHWIISLSFLLGALYQNSKVEYIMKRGSGLRNEIREKTNLLERVMDPVSFETIKKMKQYKK